MLQASAQNFGYISGVKTFSAAGRILAPKNLAGRSIRILLPLDRGGCKSKIFPSTYYPTHKARNLKKQLANVGTLTNLLTFLFLSSHVVAVSQYDALFTTRVRSAVACACGKCGPPAATEVRPTNRRGRHFAISWAALQC